MRRRFFLFVVLLGIGSPSLYSWVSVERDWTLELGGMNFGLRQLRWGGSTSPPGEEWELALGLRSYPLVEAAVVGGPILIGTVIVAQVLRGRRRRI